MRTARYLLGLVAILATVTACSQGEPVPSPTPNSAVIEQYLEMARVTDGVAPEQIEALELALQQDEVTLEQIVDAHYRVSDCLTTAGFTVQQVGMEEILFGSGIEMPGYRASQPSGMDDEAAGLVMDQCDRRYMEFLQSAYMNQPTVLEQYFAVFDTPAIRACLIERGYDVDDDATGQEINALLGEEMQDHMGESDYRGCDVTPAD